jgi:hypothetical protein
MEPLDRWLDALPLSDAWWMLGSEEHKIQYRKAGSNHSRMKFLESTMHREIITDIYYGRLLCLGVRTAPDLGKSPEILPQHLFASPDVDWSKSTVHVFGRLYADVRVIPCDPASAIESPEPAQPKKQGRPPVGDKLREVVRELNDKGQLGGLSRKEQENVIRARARERYPPNFPKQSQPSRTKILEALKAEGLS